MNGTKDIIATTTTWILPIARLGCASATLLACTAAQPHPAPPTPTPTPPLNRPTYHLLQPVPRPLLRTLGTDRPDQTESPQTVDAGHFQVEMDLVNATFDRSPSEGGDRRTEVVALAPLNLKVGLLHNTDLQLVLAPYIHARTEDLPAAAVEETSGFGDLETRLKINLWGNDDGATALALMPWVKWPLPASALRHGRTEGGIIVPFSLQLARSWNLGLMTEFDLVWDEPRGYQAEFVNSITLGRDLTARLGMYVEFFTVTRPHSFAWQGQVDVGWTCGINDHTQLDLGCNFGVTTSAPDFNPFAGLSFRF